MLCMSKMYGPVLVDVKDGCTAVHLRQFIPSEVCSLNSSSSRTIALLLYCCQARPNAFSWHLKERSTSVLMAYALEPSPKSLLSALISASTIPKRSGR